MSKKVFLSISGFFLLAIAGYAQDFQWMKKDSLYKYVQPSASLQLWGVYTMGEQVQLTDGSPMEAVQDRLNFITRRARFALGGKPYRGLKYQLSVQYDNLGKDKLGAIRGGTNTGQLGILDAFVTWKITRSEKLFVTAGYFHPQFSRECITGDMNVNSFDKSPAQGYIRNHVNGKGYGRSTGLNFGGQMRSGAITIGYNAGVFNNNTTAAYDLNESTGKYWSPILVERVTLSLGDPDQKSYSINYDCNNFFNERVGATVGLNFSSQGRTDIFSSNQAAGLDLMVNIRNLNFDAEGVVMYREVEGERRKAETIQVKAGYNIIVARKVFLEPSVMYMRFQGDEGMPSYGLEEMTDFGVNWYLNKKNFKFSLHYILQNGHGDNGYTDEVTFRKGDFIGAGWVLII